MAATSQDEFVDLYEVLALETDAESETIRKRLNELYLEAQQNLDHRNVKKRLQYQQMYEIYLPQARHLLLDPRRRGEYDRYLTAYRTGKKVAPSAQPAETYEPVGELSKTEEPPLPGMADIEVDPEKLAAEREDIWAKWKQGLELVSESTPAAPPRKTAKAAPVAAADATVSTPVASASTPAAPFARRPAPAPRANPTGTRPAPPRPRPPGTPSAPGVRPTPPAPQAGRTPSIGSASSQLVGEESEEELERQREHERQAEIQREVIVHDEAQTAGLLWGAIYAAATFLLGCVGLFFLLNRLEEFPLGMSSSTFSGIGLLLVFILSTVVGVVARGKVQYRRETQLSMLSREELLRRER